MHKLSTVILMGLLAALASPSYWWFKSNDKCFIRSRGFPESILFEVPCKYLEDITVPYKALDEYIDQCLWDKKCIRTTTQYTPGAGLSRVSRSPPHFAPAPGHFIIG
jgi:hypothetical protein